VLLPRWAGRIYLVLFFLVFSLIAFIVTRELFWPSPPIPVINVAQERAKIERAQLKLHPARFYRSSEGEVIR